MVVSNMIRTLLTAGLALRVGAFLTHSQGPRAAHAPRRPQVENLPMSEPLLLSAVGNLEVTGLDADWPEPLTAQQRLQRAARFWWQVAPTLAGYAGLLLEVEVREKVRMA